MMKVRTAYGKFLFILFFCFALISQLVAAPHNGTVVIGLDTGGGNVCGSLGNSAVLDISAGTISVSGNCKENAVGPDLPFSFSGIFPSGAGFKTGTFTQNVNGVISNAGFEGGVSYNNLNIIGLLGNISSVQGTFEALSAEPIPTLSQWSMLFLIFLLSITVYFKGIRQP